MSRVIGVDVGGSFCKLVLAERDGTVVERGNFPTDGDAGPAEFVERLARELEPWLGGSGDDRVEALGVAVAGLIGPEGVVREAPNLTAFTGWDVAGELSARLGGLPVVVENDVNAAAVAEMRRGAAQGHRNILMLALGTGVGGAIIVDGRLYRGTSGVAGELGHMTITPDGPECSCGLPGHVEAYLGTRGIVVLAGGKLDAAGEEEKGALLVRCRQEGELTPRSVALAAADGDPLSRSILEDVGRLLGLVCADYVNIFNPEVIVIGGGVAGAGDFLLTPARKNMKERSLKASSKGVRLVAAELGDAAAAIGAALLALDALSEDGGD